jgi:hypothetical protein
VRQAVAKSQEDVAEAVGIKQENISRLEGRQDMLISTLSNYIEALGGKLRLVAEMPGAPVEIALGQSRKLQVRSRGARRTSARRRKTM